MMGFSADHNTLRVKPGKIMVNIKDYSFELAEGGWPGQSGALAINEFGYAIGVLKGHFETPNPETARTFHFIHHLRNKLYEVYPSSPRVKGIIEAMTQGKFPDNYNKILTDHDLKPMEFFRLYYFILSKQNKDNLNIKKWLDRYGYDFIHNMFCYDFLDLPMDFWFNAPIKISIPKHRRMDHANRVYFSALKLNSSKFNALRSLEYYEFFDKDNIEYFNRNKRVASNFYFQYGVMLENFRKKSQVLNVSLENVENILRKSIKNNSDDYRPRHFLANIYMEDNKYIKSKVEYDGLLGIYEDAKKKNRKLPFSDTFASNLYYEKGVVENEILKSNPEQIFLADVEKSFENAVKKNPNDWRPYHSLVGVYNIKGDYKGSVLAAQTAYWKDPPKAMKGVIETDWKVSISRASKKLSKDDIFWSNHPTFDSIESVNALEPESFLNHSWENEKFLQPQ